MGIWTPGPGATGGDDTFTGDGTDETADGLGGNDTLNGGGGGDTLTGGAGVDTLNGDAGNDTLVVSYADLAAGDAFNGGADTDTLTILGGASLMAFQGIALSSIERIVFDASGGPAALAASFAASDIGVNIAANAEVSSTSGDALLAITMGASGAFTVNFIYTSWTGTTQVSGTGGADTITGGTHRDLLFGAGDADFLYGQGGDDYLDGGAGDDVLRGQAGDDFFDGGSGSDFYEGGAGDDVFWITDLNTVSGEQYYGGDDTDGLSLYATNTNGVWDLRGAFLSGIERIDFVPDAGASAWAYLWDTQFGGGLLPSNLLVVGSSRADALNIVSFDGGVYSMTSLVFSNWSVNDIVLLEGHSSFDDITGTSVRDGIFGYGGDDILHGGGGSDTLSGAEGADTLNGGADHDFLFGGDGADTLSGGDTDDTLDGGADVDTSIYAIASTAATWTRNVDGSWFVNAGAAGTDLVTTVEFLDFTDRDVFLDRAARSFSGNGTSDVLFRRSDGIMASWEVTGTSINSASFLPTAPASWNVLGTGDISGDGRDDVIWQRSDGLVYSWTMNGGSVSGAVGIASVGAQWSFLGVGDFNGDLTDDLAWQRTDGLVYIWSMNGSAIQSANAVTALPAAWEIAGMGDFNGDGRDDFLWRNSSTGQTVIWHMNGSAIQSSGATSEQAGLAWSIVGIGDTNGDGRDDILLQRASDGMIAVWAMDGTNATATDIAAADPNVWNIRNIGDYNGDGRDDILWQHDNGLVYVWLMNGASIQSAGALAGIGPDWGII